MNKPFNFSIYYYIPYIDRNIYLRGVDYFKNDYVKDFKIFESNEEIIIEALNQMKKLS